MEKSKVQETLKKNKDNEKISGYTLVYLPIAVIVVQYCDDEHHQIKSNRVKRSTGSAITTK